MKEMHTVCLKAALLSKNITTNLNVFSDADRFYPVLTTGTSPSNISFVKERLILVFCAGTDVCLVVAPIWKVLSIT